MDGHGSATGGDLALNRPATASSSDGSAGGPGAGNDGNSSTRWSSNFADNQWWQVDLGSVLGVDRVEVNWEAAYASTYRIQTSTDGTTFTTAATVNITFAAPQVTTFPARSARYVRLVGDTRGTAYGISFWDFRVFGPAHPAASGHHAAGHDDRLGSHGHHELDLGELRLQLDRDRLQLRVPARHRRIRRLQLTQGLQQAPRGQPHLPGPRHRLRRRTSTRPRRAGRGRSTRRPRTLTSP